MTEEEIKKKIEEGRQWLRPSKEDPDYKTDQMLKKPQPPLVKAPMCSSSIALPTNYEDLTIDNDFLHIINTRSSHRVYTEKPISLLSLSYLLWCTQGIKEIRGKHYATLRTVPCGGARHEFETYLVLQNVEGLDNGYYHYLPMQHRLELLRKEENPKQFITDSLKGQQWAEKANAIFYYSCVCYRAEWRYGIYAHKMIMADAGHITENLYLASTSIGLGGCAIGAVNGKLCDQAFELDGNNEFTIYAMSVGTIQAEDDQKEKDFYAFVKEQGL